MTTTRRIALTAVITIGVVAGGAVTLGSKLLALLFYALAAVFMIIGAIAKKERWKWAGLLCALLSLLVVFSPLDISFERGGHFGVDLRNVHSRKSIQIGMQTRWLVVLRFP